MIYLVYLMMASVAQDYYAEKQNSEWWMWTIWRKAIVA